MRGETNRRTAWPQSARDVLLVLSTVAATAAPTVAQAAPASPTVPAHVMVARTQPVEVTVRLNVGGPLLPHQYSGHPLPTSFTWHYHHRVDEDGEPYGFTSRVYQIVFNGDQTLGDSGIYARVAVSPFKHARSNDTIPVEIRIGPDVVARSGDAPYIVHLPARGPQASKRGIEQTTLSFAVLAPASKTWIPGEYEGEVTMRFSQRRADLESRS